MSAESELLEHKRLVLGVTGGIAAYKSAELVRRLRERQAEVKVVMTRSACHFLGPLTLQTLSGHPVHIEMLDPVTESAMGHIDLARWCDAVVVAPASANFLARLAHGIADDLLTTLCLAATAPIIVAPAMNREMWRAAATQENRNTLSRRGVRILGPAEGGQACGEFGPGRLLDTPDLLDGIAAVFKGALLSGLRVLVTAGPTREHIDPVRYLSNRSSGKMGYALAREAAAAGAAVTLVSGPTELDRPAGLCFVAVTDASEMHREVMGRVAGCDILIAVAAVADYRCRQSAAQKLKRASGPITLELEPTPDIVAGVKTLPNAPFTVAFAAETENLLTNARHKLLQKAADMVAANDVSGLGVGFEGEDNELIVLWRDGECHLPKGPKGRVAHQLIELIAERYRAQGAAQGPRSAARA
jgi:phosphopantothenoylcysteine decarboxylase/phosphopantothenate--cysteine ligase